MLCRTFCRCGIREGEGGFVTAVAEVVFCSGDVGGEVVLVRARLAGRENSGFGDGGEKFAVRPSRSSADRNEDIETVSGIVRVSCGDMRMSYGKEEI